MLFQGQEFLQGEWFRDNVPLDWHLNEEYRGIVRLYRDLIRLRLNKKGFSRGLCGQFLNIYHVNDVDNVLVFQRWDQHGAGDDVVIVLNFNNAPRENYEIGMPTTGLWKLRLNSDATIYSNDFQGFFSSDVEATGNPRDGLDACATISIGPYSMLVFSQDA
jgi:1,4-alpha-glucan branching enzyme